VEAPTLAAFVDLYLAQHGGEPETVAKLGWLLENGSSIALPTNVPEDAARRRRASRVPQMCPECVPPGT
jgi:hypothetical protein